jgi:hypothetical protein
MPKKKDNVGGEVDGSVDGGKNKNMKADVTFYVTQLRTATNFEFAFAMLGIALMLVQLEVGWHLNTAGFFPLCKSTDPDWCDPREQAQIFPLKNGNFIINIFRGLISATTVVTLFYHNRYYNILCNLLKLRNLLPAHGTLWKSPKLAWSYVFETGLLFIHTFPGIDNIDIHNPSFLIAINLGMFFRLFLLARVLRYHSSLNTSNGRFIGALTNVNFSTSFILKTALKESPVKFVTITFFSLILVSSYSLHVVDSYMCSTYKHMKCEPVSFFDAAWLLIITILTVGYGDVVPSSNGGRIITILGGLIGTLLTAVTIALTTSYLQLSRAEHKVVTFLKKDSNRKLIRKQAVVCIQAAYRYYAAKHNKFHHHNIGKHESLLFGHLRRFRELKRYVLSHDGSDATDKQITMLETMEVNMDDLRSKLEVLESSLINEKKRVGNIKSKGGPYANRVLDEEEKIEAPSNEEPGWAKSLENVLEDSTSKIFELQKEVFRLSETITRHISETNARLDKLEKMN